MHTLKDRPHSNMIPALGHWLWALPVLLIVGALAMRQIDAFAPATDEFFSMFNAGWLVNGPYSPVEVVSSLREHSPDHAPLYFILLSAWGRVVGTALAAGRLLTVLSSLVGLAMVYRLAKDFVAPIAGSFALVIVASNALFNFYLSDARMYPLLVLLAGIVLWLYLRLVYRVRRARLADYLALGAATFCLIGTHVFGLVFLIMLGIYHLLVVPKRQVWLAISVAMLAAGLLFLPYLWGMLESSGSVIESKAHVAVGSWDAIMAWLNVMLNERPALLIIPAIGLILGVRGKRIGLRPYMFMFVAYLLAMGVMAETTSLILKDSMRHHLASSLPFTLFVGAGIYGLFRIRKWLALVIILWIIAGVDMQNTARWWDYIVLRSQVFTQPPTHILSRLALREEVTPTIVAYPYHPLYADMGLSHRGNINYSQRDHYFSQHGATIGSARELPELEALLYQNVIDSSSLWLVHPVAPKWATLVDEARQLLGRLNYEECGTTPIGGNTNIRRFMWDMLDCQIPQAEMAGRTELVDYQFNRARLDIATDTLIFSDRWSARDAEMPLEPFRMSYQLIADDWRKHAQVDLPLSHPDRWRRFSIDISGVPPGNYRLMAILYHSESGERYAWLENNAPGNMLPLANIIISNSESTPSEVTAERTN